MEALPGKLGGDTQIGRPGGTTSRSSQRLGHFLLWKSKNGLTASARHIFAICVNHLQTIAIILSWNPGHD